MKNRKRTRTYTEMVNGKPVQHGLNGSVHTELMADLPKEVQDEVFKWIDKWMVPRKTPNRNHTSYGLKHLLQHDTGIYLYSTQFQEAMLIAGFEPVNYSDLNWTFCISEKPLKLRQKLKTEFGWRNRTVEWIDGK